MIKKWLITLLACLVIAGVLVVFKVMDNRAAQQAMASAPEYSETVEAAKVTRIDYQPVVRVLGQVVAPQQVALRNELSGIVAEVNFESGAPVAKGQLLIQLNINVEQAQLQSAVARAELASVTSKRIAKLRDSKTVSQEQYDKAIAELKMAEADKAMVEASIAKKTLRAPFDAIAGLHQFERGQYLEENTLITTLVGLQDFVWVDFSLSQVHGALPSDASVTIEPLFIAQAGAPNNSNWAPTQARVIAREAVMKQQSRSLSYRAQVNKGAADLLANAIVNVKVPIANTQPKLTVPALSVLYSTAGAYVYLLDADNEHSAYRARRQPVTLGEQLGDQVIVESGLAEGDHVASVGAFKLSPGLLTYLQAPDAETDSSTEPESLEGAAPQGDL